MNPASHNATGPALGYYYQAVYALITLFDSKDDNAFISLETLDDVYHEDGTTKNLLQLKHSIQKDTVITIKSEQLWSALNVWCDYISVNNVEDGLFTLVTVASLGSKGLKILESEKDSRDQLELELTVEAKRVKKGREKAKEENEKKKKNNETEAPLPYGGKYKGCEAFLKLDEKIRKTLLKNMRIHTSSFTLSEAQKEVVDRIKVSTQSQNHLILADSIIAWWDREAVKTLTKERQSCIFYSELQEFISRKNSELHTDGFTDDLKDLDLPAPGPVDPVQKKQLEIIQASKNQISRSRKTEMLARIQREKWMNKNISAITALEKYDEKLIAEWSYIFEEVKEESSKFSDEEKQEQGRKLLNWSHNEAHTQVASISNNYSNPDLIRGSYQLLSKSMKVGWHCDYINLINLEVINE